MSDLPARTDAPGSPWGWVVVGIVVGVIAVALTAVPDAPGAFIVGCWVVVGIAGLIAQFGVIAAGVEYGLRRVRDR